MCSNRVSSADDDQAVVFLRDYISAWLVSKFTFDWDSTRSVGEFRHRNFPMGCSFRRAKWLGVHPV